MNTLESKNYLEKSDPKKINDIFGDGIDSTDVLQWYKEYKPELLSDHFPITINNAVIETPEHTILLKNKNEIEFLLTNKQVHENMFCNGKHIGYIDNTEGVYLGKELRESAIFSGFEQGFMKFSGTYNDTYRYITGIVNSGGKKYLDSNYLTVDEDDQVDFIAGEKYDGYSFTLFDPNTLEPILEKDYEDDSSRRGGKKEHRENTGLVTGKKEIQVKGKSYSLTYGEEGVVIDDGNTSSFVALPHGPVVQSMYHSPWFTTRGGVYKIDFEKGKIIQSHEFTNTNSGLVFVNEVYAISKDCIYNFVQEDIQIKNIPKKYGNIKEIGFGYNEEISGVQTEKGLLDVEIDSGKNTTGSFISLGEELNHIDFHKFSFEDNIFTSNSGFDGSLKVRFDEKGSLLYQVRIYSDKEYADYLDMFNDKDFVKKLQNKKLLPAYQTTLPHIYDMYTEKLKHPELDKEKLIARIETSLSSRKKLRRSSDKLLSPYSLEEMHVLDLYNLGIVIDYFEQQEKAKAIFLNGIKDLYDTRTEYGGNYYDDGSGGVFVEHDTYDHLEERNNGSYKKSDKLENSNAAGGFHYHFTDTEDRKYAGPSTNTNGVLPGGDMDASSVKPENQIVISPASSNLGGIQAEIDLAYEMGNREDVKREQRTAQMNVDWYGQGYQPDIMIVAEKHKIIDIGVFDISFTLEEYAEQMNAGKELDKKTLQDKE